MLGKIKSSLSKTRSGVFSKINRLMTGKRIIDDDLLDELEEILIRGDVGIDSTTEIIENIRKRVKREKYQTADELDTLIIDEIKQLLTFDPIIYPDNKLLVLLMVGVNGTGKTTSTAKLAGYFKKEGKKVMLAAADTFRAAAIEQLETWGKRLDIRVVKHQANSDPAAVVYDACSAAKAQNMDILIIDTAGRLHNKVNLMKELDKIHRVIQNQIENGPQETILVLDAGNGQNAINQAREFIKVASVDSIFLTKLDGTAKGGVVIGIKRALNIPVRYIGVGEQIDDIEMFNPEEFVKGLFDK